MTDNPRTPETKRFALPGTGIVDLTGRDATAFAQAHFMDDVAQLEPGHWHWGGWLTPKGRVITLFAHLMLAPDHLRLLVLDADPEAIAAGLRRGVFRSKVQIEVPAGLHACGAFAEPAIARGASFDRGHSTCELDFSTASAARTVWLSDDVAADDGAAATAWEATDLAAGLPRLRGAQAERWTPQQLSLERLRAFSVKKGCYPGQEIVARTHFLGQAKRGLALFHASTEPDADVVTDGDAAWGAVVAQARGADGRHAVLAVGPLGELPGAPRIGDVPLVPAPLVDGLAR